VVGDLRNLTGDKLLDDSLQQAFRISLEQSRFVNVLSDLKSRDTLALMQRKPGTALDRAIASEIALRDGARAVILPTVSEVGGRVRVSAEVIDPHTQTTVYAESADGTGAASTLDSIDTVTAALRGKLGEALESVEKNSAPLPQVATNNLDALRAYALGQRAYFRGDYADATALYQQATGLDPQFAMAWLGQGRALYGQLGMTAASSPLRRAQALRNRLPPREAMYLDGWAAELEAPETALEKWRLMAKLYPDSVPANVNTAIRLMKTGYWKDELPFAERGTAPQSELIGFSFDLLGRGLMALGDIDKAAYAFDRAVAGGFRDSQERRAEIAAIRRKFSTARGLLEPLAKSEPDTHLEQMTLAVDEAQWQDAQDAAATALQLVEADARYALAARFAQASVDGLAGDVALARQRNAAVRRGSLRSLAAANETAADADEAIGVALSSALLGLQWGDREQAQQVLSSINGNQHAQTPRLSELATVVRAEMLRLDGHSQQAIKLLMPLLNGNESYQTHRVLMEAHATAGETAAAVKEAEWLQEHRGLAYAETIGYHCRQSWNVATNTLAWLRGAELLTKLDRKAEARKMLAGFDLRWPPERLPDYLRARREAVLAASRAGGV
jgi:putative peptide modification system cyclase